MSEIDLNKVQLIDARGHRCPVPTLRLQRALSKAAPGAIVRLMADDPMARIDVPHFVAHHDCRVLSMSDDAGVLIFDISNGR